MIPKKWEIVSEVGYVFEFENEDYPSITIRVIGRDEEQVKAKLNQVLAIKS